MRSFLFIAISLILNTGCASMPADQDRVAITEKEFQNLIQKDIRVVKSLEDKLKVIRTSACVSEKTDLGFTEICQNYERNYVVYKRDNVIIYKTFIVEPIEAPRHAQTADLDLSI